MGFRPAPRALTIALPCAGAAVHVVAVSQLTLVGLGPALSMLALCLVLLQLASERLLRGSAVSFFAGPLATGLVGLAILSGLAPGAEVAAGRNAWFVMHVALSALGYGARFSGGLQVAKAQVVWGIFTWVVLGWAVWVRVVRHWAGRRAALASIAGFAAVLLVYVALKLTQPGAERFL